MESIRHSLGNNRLSHTKLKHSSLDNLETGSHGDRHRADTAYRDVAPLRFTFVCLVDYHYHFGGNFWFVAVPFDSIQKLEGVQIVYADIAAQLGRAAVSQDNDVERLTAGCNRHLDSPSQRH